MAFNIMDLFAAPARNMLLQPQQSAVGIPNMLLTRPSPQNYPVAPVPSAPQIDPQTVASVQGPSAPIAAPVAGPQAAQAGPVPDKPGGFDKYSKDMFRENLNEFFLGLASGRTPAESLAFGAAAANQKHNSMKNANQTVAWLQSKGVDKEQAWQIATNPSVLSEYLKDMLAPSKPIEVGGRLVDPKTYQVLADFSDPNSKLTSDQREFQQAKADGFQGNFMDYQIKMKEAGRQQVNIDTGEKLPSGYRWVNPDKRELGVQPIPGGPATQIPGELAARIGMGENFLNNDLPILRKEVEAGNATGPIDRGMAWAGYGKPAEIQRKFQSGVEVLSRLLSGAGMTQIEVDEKTQRYMPTMADTPSSLKTKLDQLEAEIKAAGNAALRGRGGTLDAIDAPQSGNAADIAAARDAISRGAPRDAVIKRLQDAGIDTTGL